MSRPGRVISIEMTPFKEVQRLRENAIVKVTLLFLAASAAWMLWIALQAGAHSIVRGLAAVPALVSWALIAWLWVGRLETEVGSEQVCLRYWPLWFPKRIALSEIESSEAIQYRPIRDYGGWGIRWGRGGWIWNVYGNRGVRLNFNNGKHFVIGTQQPDPLAAAIEAARGSLNREL